MSSLITNEGNLAEQREKAQAYLFKTNNRFKELSSAQQLQVSRVLGEYSEDERQAMWQKVWRKIPPTIDEFLSPESLGLFSSMIFPYWREKLTNDIFKRGNIVNEIIFTGSTRSGKSSIGLLAQTYNILRIGLMRTPQICFKVIPTTTLALMLITVNLDKADHALLQPFIELLRTCTWFKEVKKSYQIAEVTHDEPGLVPFYVKDNFIQFNNNIMAFLGSRLGHTLSMSLVGAVFDEANFRIGGVEDGMNIYLTLRERLRHSFTGSKRNLLLCLISSAGTDENDVISKYIENLDVKDNSVRLYSTSVWETREPDAFDSGKFYVLRGTKTSPTRILNAEEVEKHEIGGFSIPMGCEVLPIPKKYYTDFVVGPDRALRNIAGIQTLSYEQIITEKIDFYTFLTPELELVSPLGYTGKLIDKLDRNLFMIYPNGQWKLQRYTNCLRYAHLDLAEVTEAGLTIVHKELGEFNEILFVIDFAIKIVSPTRIDLEAIQNLLEDFRLKAGINFHKISADQYQSSQLLQNLKKKRIATVVERRSIPGTLEDYYQFSNIVSAHRLKVGYAPMLREQLENVKDNNGKAATRIRKDMADSCVGAIANALENHKDSPVDRFVELSVRRPEDFKNLVELQ
jgi:hypothetical protein